MSGLDDAAEPVTAEAQPDPTHTEADGSPIDASADASVEEHGGASAGASVEELGGASADASVEELGGASADASVGRVESEVGGVAGDVMDASADAPVESVAVSEPPEAANAESVPADSATPPVVSSPDSAQVLVEPTATTPEPAPEPLPTAETASVAGSPAESAPAESMPVESATAESPDGTPVASAPAPSAESAVAEGLPAESAQPDGDAESADGAPPPPSAAPRPRPVTETGKIVEGLVTSVSAEGVELTLDDGRHAVIHRRNFGLRDEDPTSVVSVGDRAHGAELLREDPKGRVVLSRAWALKRQAWEKIVESAKENKLLTGKVVSASKKGLVVDVGVRGFVPSSHLELTPVADMSPYVGQSFELKILEVDPRREKLVLSRRSLLLKAQRKEMQELLGALKPGEVRSGTVSSLADYGAFVDLGGVNGLVHISELSWKRVSKPSQVVNVGDQVEVKILDVKPKKKRISLSIRQMTADPLSAIEVGAVQTGRVTRLVDYGAFVAIGEFEGLVHLSELAEYRVSTPEEIVAPGDEVGVKILSVDTKRRRIELSIRRAAEYGG